MTVNTHEIDGRITALQTQRNVALDQTVIMAGTIAAFQQMLKEKDVLIAKAQDDVKVMEERLEAVLDSMKLAPDEDEPMELIPTAACDGDGACEDCSCE